MAPRGAGRAQGPRTSRHALRLDGGGVSLALNRLCLERLGTIPHYDVDKALLVAGQCDKGFGRGRVRQPMEPVVAFMIEAVAPTAGDRALEIRTGSGYSAAVLASIVAEVYTVERIPSRTETAARRLAELGYRTVHVRCGDGTLGWPEFAPYDVIIVTAGGRRVPPALLDQLAPGGRLVMRVGDERYAQQLARVRRRSDGRMAEDLLAPVAFGPLIGAQGWPVSLAHGSTASGV